MTRDYAKRSAYDRKEPKKGSFLVVLFIILLIFLPGSLFYLKHFHGLHHELHLSQVMQKIHPAKLVKKDDLVEYDFYTVLPNMEVRATSREVIEQNKQKIQSRVISAQPVTATSSLPTVSKPISMPTATQSIKTNRVFLQTAVLRNYAEAEQFVSELSTVEPKLFIQQIKVDHILWYRIMAGPYPSHEEALTAQKRLKHYHIKSILAKSKAN